MAKKIKLELTEAQFNALINLADIIEAMKGGGDDGWENETKKDLRLFNRMLDNNGFRRTHKRACKLNKNDCACTQL